MNTRTLTRSALAVLGVAGLTASMSACSLLGGSVASAEVGACVDTTSMGTDEITEIPTVDCSEEHDVQVFHKFDMPDGDYPGADGVEAAAREDCIAEFDAFVGAAYEDSALDINYIGPSEQSWNDANDREILCLLFAMDGSTATESWEGSGI